MRRRTFVVSVIFILTAATAAVLMADVPQLISFQGSLYDAAGHPLNGPYLITFRIYDVESGGMTLWSEVKSVDCDDDALTTGGAWTRLDDQRITIWRAQHDNLIDGIRVRILVYN